MERKIKQPIKYGKVAKVPVVMQLEALECGAAALTMVLAYYGVWVPLEKVREDCGVSRDGSNAKNILQAARAYGLDSAAYRLEPENFKEFDSFPCIIHWNFNHFVVLNGFKNGRAYLNDPAVGAYSVSMETFDSSFTGVVLAFEPSENFEVFGKPRSVLNFAKKRLQGTATAAIFIVLTSIISSILAIIMPVFNRVFLDRIITGQSPEWLTGFMIMLIIVSLVQIIVAWINAVCSLRINGKLDIVGQSSYMWKVLHLPMKFFSQRMAGDIQMRQQTNASIASTLINTYVPLVLQTVMMFLYLGLILSYSVPLTMIGIASIIVNYVVSQYISKKRVNISRGMMRDSGKLQGTTVSGIEMIETIKASGAEDGFFEKWAGYQASVNAKKVEFARLNAYVGLIPTIVSLLMDALVTFFGYYLIIKGDFTYGLFMMFSGYLTAFMGPVNQLISASQTIQEMRTDMERIEDVMEYPSDEMYSKDEKLISVDSKEKTECAKLTGNIEIKNVTFGYSSLAQPLIRDFSMSIKKGSKVAFVGKSGCGKSTIAKLISGLYQPWSGEIEFDGRTVKQIDSSVFRGSLAVVDQDIILFNDTVKNNIKMWDDSIMDFEVIMAARDAQIHQDILEKPEGYEHIIREGGKDFSGGQKQRIEIARVLAADPTIIIMDEATSALDAKTEYNVVNSIVDRGITCIVIAHRLSTIRDCDEIIVMDNGLVVDRGTHDEFIARGGLYKELVINE